MALWYGYINPSVRLSLDHTSQEIEPLEEYESVIF